MTNDGQRIRFLTEEWGHWCEKELVRQDECDKEINKQAIQRCGALEERIRDNRDNIVALNVKAGLWGLLGGVIPVALYILVQYLS